MPNLGFDLYLNTQYSFREPYYALYPTYEKYVESGIDDEDALVSHEEYDG